MLDVTGGVVLFTADVVWFREEGSFAPGTFDLRCRWRLAAGAVAVDVATDAQSRSSFVVLMGSSLAGITELLMFGVDCVCSGGGFRDAATLLDFGGGRFRFRPAPAEPWIEALLKVATLASEVSCCLNASRTARSSGLSSFIVAGRLLEVGSAWLFCVLFCHCSV